MKIERRAGMQVKTAVLGILPKQAAGVLVPPRYLSYREFPGGMCTVEPMKW